MSNIEYVYIDTALDDDIIVESDNRITLDQLLDKISHTESDYVDRVREGGGFNLECFELSKPNKLFRGSTLLPESSKPAGEVYISATEKKGGALHGARLRLTQSGEKTRYLTIPTNCIEGIEIIIDGEINTKIKDDKEVIGRIPIEASNDSILTITMKSGMVYTFDSIETIKFESIEDNANAQFKLVDLNEFLGLAG